MTDMLPQGSSRDEDRVDPKNVTPFPLAVRVTKPPMGDGDPGGGQYERCVDEVAAVTPNAFAAPLRALSSSRSAAIAVHYIDKINHVGAIQRRVVVLLRDGLFVVAPDGAIKRCVPFTSITEIVIFSLDRAMVPTADGPAVDVVSGSSGGLVRGGVALIVSDAYDIAWLNVRRRGAATRSAPGLTDVAQDDGVPELVHELCAAAAGAWGASKGAVPPVKRHEGGRCARAENVPQLFRLRRPAALKQDTEVYSTKWEGPVLVASGVAPLPTNPPPTALQRLGPRKRLSSPAPEAPDAEELTSHPSAQVTILQVTEKAQRQSDPPRGSQPLFARRDVHIHDPERHIDSAPPQHVTRHIPPAQVVVGGSPPWLNDDRRKTLTDVSTQLDARDVVAARETSHSIGTQTDAVGTKPHVATFSAVTIGQSFVRPSPAVAVRQDVSSSRVYPASPREGSLLAETVWSQRPPAVQESPSTPSRTDLSSRDGSPPYRGARLVLPPRDDVSRDDSAPNRAYEWVERAVASSSSAGRRELSNWRRWNDGGDPHVHATASTMVSRRDVSLSPSRRQVSEGANAWPPAREPSPRLSPPRPLRPTIQVGASPDSATWRDECERLSLENAELRRSLQELLAEASWHRRAFRSGSQLPS